MNIDTSIFKSYDIRGICPAQLNEKSAYLIGAAFAVFLSQEKKKQKKALTVAVGRDGRLFSKELFKGLSSGLTDYGACVTDVGLVSSDVIYFTVGKYGFDAGVMITASHNPKEYNGFKLIKGGLMLTGEEGLPEIKKIILNSQFPKHARKGKIVKKNVFRDYNRHVWSFVNRKNIKPFKIVVDASNGMAGRMIPQVFKNWNGKIIPLNFKIDGSFPAHQGKPNPLTPNYTRDLSQKVLKEKADLGVTFDGDADRLKMVDEKGKMITGDLILALLAERFLQREKGGRVLYNLISSHMVPEVILKNGGRPVRSRVGHVFIKRLMKEKDIILGGEISGHFYFRDNFYADSAFITLLIILEILSVKNQPISRLIKPFDCYFRSGEINMEVKGPNQKIKKIEKKYHSGKIDHLDGLTIEYKNWWLNIRLSGTEPLLRLNIEAETKELMEKKKREIVELIK